MSEVVVEKVRGEESFRQGSLRDLYCVVFRHKSKMVLFFLTVTSTVAIGTFLAAEIYRSEAKLLVRLGRESIRLDPTATTGQIISNISQSRKDEINSEVEILRSRELLQKLVEIIGPGTLLNRPDEELPGNGVAQQVVRETRREIRTVIAEPRNLLERLDLVDSIDEHAKAVLLLMRNLNVEASRDSSIITVSYEAQSRELARDVVAKLIDLYMEKHIAVHQTSGSHEFFVQQSNHLLSKLTKLEDELRNLKDQTGISSLEEQRKLVLSRIGALEQEIENIEAGLAASRAKVETLRKTLQPTLPVEQANISSLQAKVETQKRQLAEALEGLKALNESEIRITRLEREISMEETNYRKYSESLEQARIDHALEAGNISNISVVQPATVPIKSIRPRKLLNLALGVFLGVLGAIGLAFVCEYLDHSIRTPEQIEEKLQLPALASIPLVRTNKLLSNPRRGDEGAGGRTPIPWKSRVIAARLRRTTNGNGHSETWSIPAQIRQQYSALAEQFLLSSNGSAEKPHVLAIVSCHHGEGTSTVATNLSAALAQRIRGDVLLMNVTSERSSVHRVFKSGHGNGDSIFESPEQKLSLLVADRRDINLSEVLDSDKLTTQLRSMKQPYGFVVIDLPPLSQTSYMPRLSGLCDNVVMVVEAERLRWEVVQKAKERLANSQANILGIVLNKRRHHIPSLLYRTL